MRRAAILLGFAVCVCACASQKRVPAGGNTGMRAADKTVVEPTDGLVGGKQPLPGGGPDRAPDDELDGVPDGLHVVGAIPKDSIHRVVRENFASIRQCYEQLVMANPGLQGRVIAKFKVGLDGTVHDAAATGVHPDLETCVATQVRKFKFPRPDAEGASVEVEYPFTFKPG